MRPIVRNLFVASGIVAVTLINVAIAHRTASASGTAAAKAAITISLANSGQGTVGKNGQRLSQGATCPAGTKVIGGGFFGQTVGDALTGKSAVIAATSMPDQKGNAWRVNWVNGTMTDQPVNIWAVCLAE
jgi:hypothetical protein